MMTERVLIGENKTTDSNHEVLVVELLQCDHWSQISLFYNPKICPNFQTEYSTRKLSIDIVMLSCGKFDSYFLYS